jgi:hypothetical protein
MGPRLDRQSPARSRPGGSFRYKASNYLELKAIVKIPAVFAPPEVASPKLMIIFANQGGKSDGYEDHMPIVP